jgi:four helix bundle protein
MNGGQKTEAGDQMAARRIFSFCDLRVYQAAMELQQAVFESSKSWPREEKFSLVDQARRSSRSVGANIAEAWAKRKYPLHFISKLTDADGELQETSHWLSTALTCNDIAESEHAQLQSDIKKIGKMLGKMMSMPEKFSRDG